MSVFVELDIRAGIEDLWSRTQDPVQHERWDLRFSSIEYAAASEPDGRQGFDYETRLGFGLAIRGAGETIADRDLPDGGRVSSLRFSSGSRWSLIREGRGYWAYSPTPGSIPLAMLAVVSASATTPGWLNDPGVGERNV